MNNNYNLIAINTQENLFKDLNLIFEKTNNLIKLKFGGVNLFKLPHNAVQSSTAIGFLLEEYVFNKLNKLNKKYVRDRYKNVNSSYDFMIVNPDVDIYVNVKTEQTNNNSISSLNLLTKDYVDNITKPKLYLLLKIKYQFEKNHIKINNIETFYLEQLLKSEIATDNRRWGTNKINSGRIVYPKKPKLKSIFNINYWETAINLLLINKAKFNKNE